MKPLTEVYKKSEFSSKEFYESDYGPLLESMGWTILLKVDDQDYQGDSRVLFRDGNRYGFLIFGWGSCSGCDALQACDTFEEAEQLRNRLVHDTEWYDSKENCLRRINTKDWELDHSWHAEETKQFIIKAKALLSK